MPALDDDREGRVSIDHLRSLVEYNPETGQLLWRARADCPKAWNTRYAGTAAFDASSGHQGYRAGFIARKKYYAHRVAWALAYGEWPSTGIDHVDGDRTNNRISNLRMADCVENGRNASLSRRNKSGRTGVFKASGSRCVAKIGIPGNYKHLGSFPTFEAACAARSEAERQYGFHQNHGRGPIQSRST